ncbi:MAG: lactate racemase domain-containing protein [Anaerolineae bacterium]
MGTGPPLLTEAEIHALLSQRLERLPLQDRRVLLLVPDGTRTAPLPLLFRHLRALLADLVQALDVLIALGTHPPMSEAAIRRHLGLEAGSRSGRGARLRVFNHRWDDPETFVNVGRLAEGELHTLSGGRLRREVPITVNRRLFDYDHLIVCGPVFPHEVVGFSGGTKYFVPGVAGQEIIDVTHWLGALLTTRAVIGRRETPVRRLIDRAVAFVDVPTTYCNLVVSRAGVHGLTVGAYPETWAEAVGLSSRLHIRTVERRFRRVLSVMPRMYDDLWTAAKGMYKVESVVEDGGEVIIYAPHIEELSYTHGKILDEIGYHVRDYFVKQWERFRRYPWGVLAHSTHVRGAGTYDAVTGVEQSRIRVTLATGILRARCERVNLGYRDPATLDPADWVGREEEGLLLVSHAGEQLYRLAEAEKEER